MIKKTPRRFPTLADMLRDLSATPDEAAKALDVDPSTIYRWLKHNNAPRTAMLSLYWMTQWGLSELDAELFNRAQVYEGLARALDRELLKMREALTKLQAIGQYGAANDPLGTWPGTGLPQSSPSDGLYTSATPPSLTQPVITANRCRS